MTWMVVATVAVLAGALVRGYTGFGASMFWVSSLSLLFAPESVVPTVLILEVLSSLSLLPHVVGSVRWASMRWMLGATIVTMPVGIAILAVLPAREMRMVVAVALLLATLAVASGVRLAGRPGRRSMLTAGAVSGVVNGSTGMGGPPAVLLYFNGENAVEAGRATLIAYFLGTDAVGFLMMTGSGLVDRTVLVHAGVFTPLALVGIYAGQRLYHRWGERGFRKVVLGVLLVLSVAMLLRALFVG